MLWLYEAQIYKLFKAAIKNCLFLLDRARDPVYLTALSQGIRTMETLTALIHADVNTYYSMASALNKEDIPRYQRNT